MKPLLPWLRVAAVVAVVAGLAGAGYVTRDRWLPMLRTAPPTESATADAHSAAPSAKVLLTDDAIKNLRLKSDELKRTSTWRTIQVPGMVVDRPGYSDRGVVAPAAGVVITIRRLPGETVRAGEPLFTLKLLSEPLHQTQTDLFKAVQDIDLAQEKRERLKKSSAVISGQEIIEVENQIARLQAAVRAYREELRTRGLSPEQIDGVAHAKEPKFVTEIVIGVPARSATANSQPTMLEMQELKVDLGQQVQPGQALCVLADHRSLAIEGRAFREETPLLERSVKEGWSVEVDFQEPPSSGWPALGQEFYISHLSNSIDPVNRTFAFLLQLENQSRVVERATTKQMLWRFRPGQKVWLHVRVEKLDNVFVLPPEAVARDGPESVVFVQNVNTFERTPVRVLVRERTRVVIADTGDFPAGTFVAQSSAALLNRMAKSQTSAVPKGYHVHADGSLHKNGEEEK